MDADSHSSMWSRLFPVSAAETRIISNRPSKEAREDGELKAEEGSMLLSILTLDELQVQDIMTPRTDIDCVASGTSVAEVRAPHHGNRAFPSACIQWYQRQYHRYRLRQGYP